MSAYVTANGIPVVSADIIRPRIGNWHADLTVDAQNLDHFTGPVTITLADTLSLSGTVFRIGVHHDTVFIRVQGGKGGFGTVLAPRGYTNVPLRLPLSDALREAGEVLSSTADPGALGSTLPRWIRMRQGAGAELRALVDASGAEAWRVLPDGTIWIGNEAWPASQVDFQEIDFEPELGRLHMAADIPNISPGEVLPAPGEPYDGWRVSSVRHVSETERIRHYVMFEEAGDQTDRLGSGLEAIFRARVDPLIDAASCYWAQVIAQNSDGTLELRPDSRKLPDLSNVPIRTGLPGTVKVAAGARVLVEFGDGDMAQPIATLWGTSSAIEIALGPTPNQPAALATALRTELNAIWAALYGGHTHVIAAVQPGTGTITSATAIGSPSTQTIASSVVKVAT